MAINLQRAVASPFAPLCGPGLCNDCWRRNQDTLQNFQVGDKAWAIGHDGNVAHNFGAVMRAGERGGEKKSEKQLAPKTLSVSGCAADAAFSPDGGVEQRQSQGKVFGGDESYPTIVKSLKGRLDI